MSSVWIILLLFLGGMSMFYSRAKRAMAADTSAQESNVSEDGDNQDDSFVSYIDNEWDEAVASQPEVFSYETKKGMSTPMSKAEETIPLEQPPAPRFDLRQAVIYQTVLSNNYINSEN